MLSLGLEDTLRKIGRFIMKSVRLAGYQNIRISDYPDVKPKAKSRFFASMLVVGVLVLATSFPAFAEVSIETSVSRSRLAVGEELTLDIIVSNATGSISQPTLPPMDGFSSYSQGHSQEISIINGRSSSQSIFSYVLIANSIGKKTIGPFEIKIGDKVFKVAPVQVEVTSDNPSPFAQQSSTMYTQGPVVAPPPRAMPGDQISNQDIFVKAWLDKDEAYVNEPVMLTYTIYTRLSATYKGFEKEPVTTGFWVEDFPPDKTVKRTEQVFNGSRYVVADIRKMALFPTEPGVFTVDPGTVGTTVEVRDEQNFDSFFSSNIFGRRNPFPSPFFSQVFSKIIPTDKVTIVAKALPESGKPKSFTGAVGDYRIESSIDKGQVEVGTPITYKVRILGEGNLNTVQTPALPKMDDFKVYDSSSAVNISKNRLIVEGEKVTETVLVPKKAGSFTIPELEFSYYDYKAKTYRTIKTSAHTISVKPGAEPEETSSNNSAGVQPVEQEEVSVTGTDIRYIKTINDPHLTATRPLYKMPLYWLFNSLLFLASLALMIVSNRRVDSQKSLLSRSRGSHRVAKAKLKKASNLMKQDKEDEFFGEISKAVYGYFADKLGISSQAVNIELIEQKMPQDSSPEILNQIKALFDELSMGRFAAVRKGSEEMKHVYQMADNVITGFEKVKLK